jgi:NAD(P)H-dependent flavin oxidoreductase YrpB (nitropropane dioxygenase family)
VTSAHGVVVAALAVTCNYALWHAPAGVDLIVAQASTEAGGHTCEVDDGAGPEVVDLDGRRQLKRIWGHPLKP